MSELDLEAQDKMRRQFANLEHATLISRRTS
jgi:hypothetical protein